MSDSTINLAKEFRKKLIDNDSSITEFCKDNSIEPKTFRLALNGYDTFLKSYLPAIEDYLR
jgi:hypothetical protein